MGAMRVRRRRSSDEDEAVRSVVVLTSSDDEEANRDLSIEIVERAIRRGEDDVKAIAFEHVDVEKKKRKKKKKNKEKVEVEEVMEKKEKKRRKKRRREEEEREPEAIKEDKVTDATAPEGEAIILGDTVQEEPVRSVDSEVTEVNDGADDLVLRKLLRGPRYFDSDGFNWQSCHNCGEEGHFAANCTEEKRRKPCFVCGAFGHNPKHCLQAPECFVCKRRGHIAKDCPDKHQRGSRSLKFCLQCGDVGHDMWSCSNAYLPEDLEGIQCYVCKQFGHLCCIDFQEKTPIAVSCYNCGQSGHSGTGCGKKRWENYKVESPSLCYACGKEGHLARSCTKNRKPGKWSGDTSPPYRNPKKHEDIARSSRSAPHYLGKPYKNGIHQDWSADDSGSIRSKRKEINGFCKSPSMQPIRKCPKLTKVASANRTGSNSSHNKHMVKNKMPAPLYNARHLRFD